MMFHNYLLECRPKLIPELNKQFIIGSCGAGMVDRVFRLLMRYSLFLGGKSATAENIRRSVIYNGLNIDKKSIADVQVFAGQKLPSTTESYISKIDFLDRDTINAVHPMERL